MEVIDREREKEREKERQKEREREREGRGRTRKPNADRKDPSAGEEEEGGEMGVTHKADRKRSDLDPRPRLRLKRAAHMHCIDEADIHGRAKHPHADR